MEELNLSEVGIAHCSKCNTAILQENIFCQECGFPENGTEKDVAQFHARNVMKKNEHMDADKKIKSARNVLYVIAGITILAGLFYFFRDQDIAILVTNVILGIIYLVLGSWTSKKPLIAILLGLFLYLTTIIIAAIVDPATIIRGIIFKILIIAYLGKGVYSASSIKK
ncbi:zinc ribbon domain-containing protein [Winogradskyella forsetii]|uniref:zinc ribbon domain-containing protein n=1 Tax=Winogradskyella forsetii TaxID=2686077 RepID=UPI0015BD34C9|nr:zinc ribbon domain-containing protein [Winogradskyella forsetii]